MIPFSFVAASFARRSCLAAAKPGRGTIVRSLAVRRSSREIIRLEPIPPGHTIDSVKPPFDNDPNPDPDPPDPMAYVRKPVASVHAIDLLSDPPRLSDKDSVSLSSSGSVVHGRYGELDPDVAQGVPLEYLALLHPAAEAAAALRVTLQQSSVDKGTILVFGATQPSGLAAVQLATAAGQTVVAVIGGEHSGNDKISTIVKDLTEDPGTAVSEELALVKALFRDLVYKAVHGDDPATWTSHDPHRFLSDFKRNLLDYIEVYPDTLPAAVGEEHLQFPGGTELDRTHFQSNMEAYLSQFPPGAAPIDPRKLDRYFTKEQYAAWRAKFLEHTASVITGEDPPDFVPVEAVREMLELHEPVDDYLLKHENVTDGPEGEYVPFEFSVLKQTASHGLETRIGGPLLGAIVAVTPDLRVAAEAAHKAGTSLRAKAEALHFLTEAQKNAFAAARSVVTIAKRAGKSVVVIGGSIPGLNTIQPNDMDVQAALSAMEIEEDGTSRLNYYLQVYRASDYPVYADYAIHRATEALTGPRQIIVTK